MRHLLLCLLIAVPLVASDAKYDGARVHYESHGKGKEAVVFIHGWSCDLTFWRGQAPVYDAHRSLLIDLPGHGQSDKPDVSYTPERFARAIEAVMRDARDPDAARRWVEMLTGAESRELRIAGGFEP